MFAIPPEVWYNESNSLCAGGDGRRGMEQLSGMQQKIYEYIVSCVRDQGYPPSVREIGDAVGLKSPSTVHFHLKHRAQAGVIAKGTGKGRAITLTQPPEMEDRVPIVGNVAAGSPILAQECI